MSHAWQYAEVVPLLPFAPAAGEGLAALFPLMLWGLALALLIAWRWTYGAIFEHIANTADSVSIPTPWGRVHPLGAVSRGIRAVDDAVQHLLLRAASAGERSAVYLFHHAVAAAQEAGHELYRLAEDTVRAVQLLERHSIPRLIAQALIPPLAAIAAVRTLVHVIRVELRHDAARFRAQVHTLAHATTVALPREIARVGGRVGHLEREIEGEAGRLSRVEKLLGAATFAGLVSVALDRWLGKWWRCPSLRNIGRHTGCKGFKFLEDLLLGVIDVLLISDLCRITKALITTAESQIVQDALSGFIDGIEHLMLCQGTSRPKVWHVHAATLPPKQHWSVLPPVG